MCLIILEMTSSTFTPQTQSLKKFVTSEADDNCGIWHLRRSLRLILYNRVRLWMCGITSHSCSYGEVSGNGSKCHPTYCCYSALGRHCQELSWSWGWEVLQHPPNFPDLSPWFSDLILKLHGKQYSKRENILTAVWHKVAQVSMLHNDDGVYLLFHHWQQTIDSLQD
jgi:hypothetical protein